MQDTTVPVITQPVRQLKERFTLSGEPLPISTCMKQLGLDIINHGDEGHECSYALDPIESKQHEAEYLAYFFTDKKTWQSGVYSTDDKGFTCDDVSEADVLMGLIRRFYQMKIRKNKLNPSDEVLASLSARLVPLATQDQLDALRADIRNIRA